MDDDFREYEFMMPDGSVRYEMVGCRAEMFAFKAMHGAVRARPVPQPEPDGTSGKVRGAANSPA